MLDNKDLYIPISTLTQKPNFIRHTFGWPDHLAAEFNPSNKRDNHPL